MIKKVLENALKSDEFGQYIQLPPGVEFPSDRCWLEYDDVEMSITVWSSPPEGFEVSESDNGQRLAPSEGTAALRQPKK